MTNRIQKLVFGVGDSVGSVDILKFRPGVVVVRFFRGEGLPSITKKTPESEDAGYSNRDPNLRMSTEPAAFYFEVLDSHVIWSGECFVVHIAGVDYARRFETDHFGFFIRTGAVLDSAGDHHAFSRSHGDNMVSEFDAKISLPNKEQFVFVIMAMPRKLTLHFDNFDFLTVQSRNDFGAPMVIE